MNKLKLLLAIVLLLAGVALRGQTTLYVDAVKGKDVATGTLSDPFLTIDKAVGAANSSETSSPVIIRLAPGYYMLSKRIIVKHTERKATDTSKLIFEATIMPDDTAWRPGKMPVIQSVAINNIDTNKFKHCTAFLIERNNVSFKGLKFLGNPNPGIEYYYVIERRNEKLKGLEVSQCYFIGDKNSASVQGGVFAQGAAIKIDHCVFYNCKNAVLVFLGLKDFSFTHSIVYGAYEAAIWYGYGKNDEPLVFSNNVVTNCNYVWVSDKSAPHQYKFSNSLIVNNKNYRGFNGMKIEGPDLTNTLIEDRIIKQGKVALSEVTAKGIPRNYLNLSPESAGQSLHAGIFKN
ncbi:MAG: right-handed parallel beta-helix repeat-containing protein [Mucilaginibacter sp.]